MLDSGIDAGHPHFAEFDNLRVPDPLAHTDFTPAGGSALTDEAGHGTHVAGIIAGQWQSAMPGGEKAIGRETRGDCDSDLHLETLTAISGVALRCKLLSLKRAIPSATA